jgi:phage baseplate assembly protein W
MAQFNSKNQSSRVARRWFTDLDVNMTLHPQSGDVTIKSDINSIKRSVKNLLQTNHYERPFKPDLGLELRGMLFELDNTDSIILEDNIKKLIGNYEPRAMIDDVLVSSIGNSLNVSLYFTVKNDPSPHEIDLVLQRVR